MFDLHIYSFLEVKSMNLQPHSLECPRAICRVPRVKPVVWTPSLGRTSEESRKFSQGWNPQWMYETKWFFRDTWNGNRMKQMLTTLPCCSPFCGPFSNGQGHVFFDHACLHLSHEDVLCRKLRKGECSWALADMFFQFMVFNKEEEDLIYLSLSSFTWRMNFKIAWQSTRFWNIIGRWM